MTLKELRDKENLSVRTYNICRYSNLLTLNDILLFFHYHKSFKKIRNCGVKSEKELLNICSKYQIVLDDLPSNDSKSTEIEQSFRILLNNESSFRVFLKDVEYLYENLRIKSKNIISSIIKSDTFDVNEFIQITVFNPLDFKDVRSCGTKTAKELDWFRLQVKSLIEDRKDKSITPGEIVLDELRRIIGFTIENDENLLWLIDKKELNILYLIDRFILTSSKFKTKDRAIFNLMLKRNKNTDDNELYLKLANSLGLTRERVRQLSVKFKNQSHKKFQFLTNNFVFSYNLMEKLKSDYWKINTLPLSNEHHFLHIENNEQTLANLLELFGSNSYYVLTPIVKLKGTIGPYDNSAYKRFRALNINYLINESFIPKEKVLEVFNDLYFELIDRISEDCIFSLLKYGLDEQQTQFLKAICVENFALGQDDFNNLILKRNTIITAPEIIEKILIEFDELMTAEEILVEYNNRIPHANKEINSIRGALQKERFIFFRGNGLSRYGLVEWEKDRGLKSGNIKTLCKEFIENEKNPVHIFKLTKFIRLHRKTNQKNVLTNLKLGNNKDFIFFTGGYIGLKNKDYPKDKIESFVSLSPNDGNSITYFVKNHWYYDYEKIIHKYTTELGLTSDQIESLIDQKVSDGILKVKNDKVYYNQIDEDALCNLLFLNFGTKKDTDFNPYRIFIESFKLLSRISIISENQFELKSDYFQFSKYDLDNSNFRSLIFYQKVSKNFICIIWKNDDSTDYLMNKKMSFSENTSFEKEEMTNDISIFKFPSDRLNGFKFGILNKLKDSQDEKIPFDINSIDIKGLNKMQAYSCIIEKFEREYKQVIDLTKAKDIYELIQLNLN